MSEIFRLMVKLRMTIQDIPYLYLPMVLGLLLELLVMTVMVMYAGHVRIYEYSSGSWTQLGADIDGEAAE